MDTMSVTTTTATDTKVILEKTIPNNNSIFYKEFEESSAAGKRPRSCIARSPKFVPAYIPGLITEKPPKKPCDRPCIRKVFRPLGVFAKCFGLFPCYDLNFVERLNDQGVKWVHIADYCYTGLVFLIMTAGAVICGVWKPRILVMMKEGAEDTDYYVISTIFYMTIFVGVWSLFVFPKSWCKLLHYLDHFAHVDKILQFDGSFARQERNFARRLLYHLSACLLLTMISWYLLFVGDLKEDEKEWNDYLLVPITTLSVMVNVIPSSFFVFFVNSIHYRLLQFNDKVRNIILPITPSCFACKSFMDYGKELDDKISDQKSEQLAFDIEKLRILHGEVTDLVQETSDIFGPHLIRDFASALVGIILYSYFLLFLREDQGNFWFVYIIILLFVVAKVVILCWFGDCIKQNTLSLLKLLQKVSALRLTPECSIQIQMFIKKLDTPVFITAADFFTIDKRLLTAIVGSITTYFIILVQFKLTDMSSELSQLADCNFTTSELLLVLSKRAL